MWLNNADFLTAIDFRLCRPIMAAPGRCTFCRKAVVDIYGEHALLCMHGGNRSLLSDSVVKAVASVSQAAGLPTTSQPTPFLTAPTARGDLSVHQGNTEYVIDVAVTHALLGRPTEYEAVKEKRYGELTRINRTIFNQDTVLIPFVMDSIGGRGSTADFFMGKLAKIISLKTDEAISVTLRAIWQRINVTLTRGVVRILQRATVACPSSTAQCPNREGDPPTQVAPDHPEIRPDTYEAEPVEVVDGRTNARLWLAREPQHPLVPQIEAYLQGTLTLEPLGDPRNHRRARVRLPRVARPLLSDSTADAAEDPTIAPLAGGVHDTDAPCGGHTRLADQLRFLGENISVTPEAPAGSDTTSAAPGTSSDPPAAVAAAHPPIAIGASSHPPVSFRGLDQNHRILLGLERLPTIETPPATLLSARAPQAPTNQPTALALSEVASPLPQPTSQDSLCRSLMAQFASPVIPESVPIDAREVVAPPSEQPLFSTNSLDFVENQVGSSNRGDAPSQHIPSGFVAPSPPTAEPGSSALRSRMVVVMPPPVAEAPSSTLTSVPSPPASPQAGRHQGRVRPAPGAVDRTARVRWDTPVQSVPSPPAGAPRHLSPRTGASGTTQLATVTSPSGQGQAPPSSSLSSPSGNLWEPNSERRQAGGEALGPE